VNYYKITVMLQSICCTAVTSNKINSFKARHIYESTTELIPVQIIVWYGTVVFNDTLDIL